MFAKLHLTLLALAAAAVAQTPGERYYIRNAVSGRVLDIRASGTAPGVDVIIYPRNNPPTPNQQWVVDDEGYIQNVNSKLYITAIFNSAGRLEAGAFLQQFPKNGIDNQRWYGDSQRRLINRYNQNLAIWGLNGDVTTPTSRAVVDYKNNNNTQAWYFDRAP